MALRRIVTAAILLAFFASCSESSLFIPDVEETPDVTIGTIEDGAVVTTGDTIPLDIEYADQSRSIEAGAELLDVSLVDVAEGVEVAGTTLDADDLMQPQLPPIELADMPTGLYRLELELSDSDGILASRKVEFFHVAEPYRVLGIATYPPAFFPDASGLLQANIDVPEGSDPYLRWTMNGEIISASTVSEGGAEVILRSPDAPGVYPVTLELFPVAPPDRLEYDFASSLSQTSDVYVAEEIELEEWELGPEISYFTLFHFRGELKDWGVASGRFGSALSAEPIGGPDLRIHGDIFGYRLDGESGFALDRSAVPFDGDALAPFSINLRILFETDEPGQRIMRTEAGNFALELATDDAGALRLVLESADSLEAAISDAFLVRPGEPLAVTISVFPLEDSAYVMWFRDGVLVGVSEVGTWPDGADPTEGSTVIGGEEGFVGIIDELGVYFQNEQEEPATYDEAFRHAMSRRYGETLMYAEDFSGVSVPDEVDTQGDVRVMTGELILEPGARVVLPRFLFAEEDLLVELDSSSDSGALTIAALQGADEGYEEVDVFVVSTAGTVIEPAAKGADAEGTDDADDVAEDHGGEDDDADALDSIDLHGVGGGLAFRLVHTDGSLELVGSSDGILVELDDRPFGGVMLSLDNEAEAAVPLRVMSVLVRRGQSAISRALTSQAESADN